MRKITVEKPGRVNAGVVKKLIKARKCDRVYPSLYSRSGEWVLWTPEAGGKHTLGRAAIVVLYGFGGERTKMKFETYEQQKSGLIVPKKKPEPPKRKYGPLEIQDEERRELTAEGLSKLWDAMNLSSGGGGIRLPDSAYETHYQVYRFVGKMLLGKDYPEKEVLT